MNHHLAIAGPKRQHLPYWDYPTNRLTGVWATNHHKRKISKSVWYSFWGVKDKGLFESLILTAMVGLSTLLVRRLVETKA